MSRGKAKLKVWKTYSKDHERANRIGRRDQQQPDVFRDLIDEPVIMSKIEAALKVAVPKAEEAKPKEIEIS